MSDDSQQQPTQQPQREAAGPQRPTPVGIPLGTIAGAQVRVTPSWFLVAALLSVIVAPRIEQVQPGLGGWKYVAGFAFAVILYLAILLHEASHAWMAKRQGARVLSITLHFLGGATAVEGEARSAGEEFKVAVVGPITSIAIGLAALGAWFLVPPGLVRVGIEGMAGANLLIGVLNLVPALPLDGGRVLKAGVWRATGDRHRASIFAGNAGKVAAVAVLGWPFLFGAIFDVVPGPIDFILVGVVALFLYQGAHSHVTHAKLMRDLSLLSVRELVRRACLVPEETPLAQAVARAQQEQAGSIVTLDAHGQIKGIVSEQALLAVPAERRPWLPVSSVATTIVDAAVLTEELAGEELIRAIGRHPAGEYLVLNASGSMVGVLATVDLNRAFRA